VGLTTGVLLLIVAVCWCGAASLTRGWICRLQLLLDLASAAIFVSVSRVTHDHILLPQIIFFSFRRLLGLSGIRWGIRPRLHTGYCLFSNETFFVPLCTDRIENTVYNNIPVVVGVFTDQWLKNGLHNPVVLLLRACMLRALPNNGRCLQSYWLVTDLYITVLIIHPGLANLKMLREYFNPWWPVDTDNQ
jgi:hypothetical protein